VFGFVGPDEVEGGLSGFREIVVGLFGLVDSLVGEGNREGLNPIGLKPSAVAFRQKTLQRNWRNWRNWGSGNIPLQIIAGVSAGDWGRR